MCGIVGLFSPQTSEDEFPVILERMNESIRYRGPDSRGSWVKEGKGIGFGHLRLAILDLTPEGHQPMHSASGRFTIVFNGEVYNYQELREDLQSKGHRFRGGSDTEVMLASFEEYGIAPSLPRFNGMFAFALYDAQNDTLTFVRDRFGVKPLYYSISEWGVGFSSEVKPFLQIPRTSWEINRDALGLFIRHGFIPQPYSIYHDIFKLPAGTSLTIRLSEYREKRRTFSPFPSVDVAQMAPRAYWSAREVLDRSQATPWKGSEVEAIEALDSLLKDSIRLRMVSDVPLGAFLSGGIDSSTVVALMQAVSTQPVKTFTIGFKEDAYNEASFAKEVAAHLGTDHTELYLTAKDSLEVIPTLGRMFDEPFADSSQIPTYLVSKLAREKVTVSLSGDGGDELFGGYSRFDAARRIWNVLSSVPSPLRRAGGACITAIPAHGWDLLLSPFRQFLPEQLQVQYPGSKVHRFASLAKVKNGVELYQQIMSFIDNPSLLVHGARNLLPLKGRDADGLEIIDQMMCLDTVVYLPDDILVKVDRATMAVSLEGREPLLDYRLFEFAWTLPQELKIRNGKGKWILRQVLHKYVPPALVERPKMGFSVPIGEWLRGDLRSWAEDLLQEEKLQREGFLSAPLVRQYWNEHLSGKRDWMSLLWNVLMFQAWREEYRS